MEHEMTYDEFKKSVKQGILTPGGNCPVASLLETIQGKWKAQILYALCIHETLRFGEIQKLLPSVTHTVLTNALREMEREGLIHREQFNEIPPHVEYSLTEKGKDLLPVFYEMMRWGMRYIP